MTSQGVAESPLKPGAVDADSRAHTWPMGWRREGPAYSYTHRTEVAAAAGLSHTGLLPSSLKLGI